MKDISKSSESDNTAEMFCEYCYEKEQKNVTAEGFCVQCVKYFCKTCLGYHSKFLPDHIQQDKSIMPQDFYIEKCKKHPKELLKFYCISCENIACLTCKTTLHAACKDIHHLPKLVAEFDTVKECSTLEDKLDLLDKEAEDLKESIVNQRQENENLSKNAIQAVNSQRQDVEKIFKKFEGEINSLHTENKSILESEDNKNDLLRAEIKDLKMELRGLKETQQKSMIYLETKKLRDKRKSIKEKIKCQKHKLKHGLNRYSFKKAPKNFMSESFGKVTGKEVLGKKMIVFVIFLFIFACTIIMGSPIETKNTLVKTFTSIRDKFIKHHTIITIEKISEISLESLFSSNPEHFNVERIFHFHDNLLIFCNTEYLHLYNMTSERAFRYYRPFINHIIAASKVNEIMVAFLRVDRVVFFEFTSTSARGFRIDIFCKDIHYRAGKLFLACPNFESDQYVIQVYDEDGNKISSFIIISGYTNEMTVSPDGKTIYISEWKENLVKSYTTEGKLIAEYQDQNLKHPRKMTVDRKGNLFVFGSASNNIFYITHDLTYGYEITEKSHNHQEPDSLSYDEENNILYISSNVDKTIEVFKVAYCLSKK